MPHPVTKFQILSAQPDVTAAFYGGLFGWRTDANNPMGYREIHTGSDSGIQGGIWPAPPQARPFVQLFIQSDDLEATAKKAQELGARVVVPPSALPDGDCMAVLTDPTGLAFAIWKPRG
jgi:predicted enzyme related to lactoylglutathione lyase